MAGKSPTEAIHELRLELTKLAARVDGLTEQLARVDLVRVSERLAVLESKQADAQKREDQNDGRRWQLVVLFLGSLVTLGIQLAVLFLKK